MRRLLILAALVQGGCFSGDDFSACTQVGQPCGRAQICVEPGVCAFVDAVDEGVVQDRGQRPDARRDAGTETLEFTEKLPPRLEADGADVALRTAEMEGASTLIQGARTIEVSQGIVADGRGSPGGGGGGGGAGATQGPAATGGAGADRAGDGQPGADAPGDGGDGAPGSAPGNARGGAGGTLDAPDGQPGDEGTFPDSCDNVSAVRFRLGDGGGGGGGGRGAEASGCVAPGGGGGGRGGPGGGAIVLTATDRIVIRGMLTARGEAGPADGGAGGGPPCEACGDCGAGAGRGGAGSAVAGPGPGLAGAGGGGRGGAGSGGMVLLEAPVIEFAPGAGIDVSGGGSEASGGLIALRGRVEGSPVLLGAGPGRQCP